MGLVLFGLSKRIVHGMMPNGTGKESAMKRITFPLLMVIAAGSTGCSTMSNTDKGVGLGGLVGAGVGTAVGAATGNPKTGAVVGGLLGAGVGGAIGSEADQKEREQARAERMAQINAQQAQAQARKMGMIDVVQMNQSGVAPQVIINQIRSTGSTFTLSQADLQYLTEQHVPNEVIVAMQTAQPTTVIQSRPRTVIVNEPDVIIERPYYPRPYYGPSFGVTYIRRW
ncbi:MAG: glycine zipper domain-containing protein [Gemmataceae bacterium]